MTPDFDEMVGMLRVHGDKFMSVIRTAKGWQANAESRYGGGAYCCDAGDTPTEALRNLCQQRCKTMAPAPEKPSVEDLI
jgi:hypothetical protein